MSALHNIAAMHLQAGDLYLGNYVQDAPTRPVQPFANAWMVARVTRTEGTYLGVPATFIHPIATVPGGATGREFDLTPLRPVDRVLVLR
jgi:hypothetical protein